MKSMKMITIATLALVAAALLVSTAAAMPVGYSSNSAYVGMMGGYNHPQSVPAVQRDQAGSSFSFGRMMSWMGSGFGQIMRCLRL